MKQKDLAMIIAVAGISTILAFVLSGIVIGSPKTRQAKVEVIDSISSEFPQPDSKYFNSTSVNPTQKVKIGGSSNPQPFNQ